MGITKYKNLAEDFSLARNKLIFIKRAKEAFKKERRKVIRDSLIYLFSGSGLLIIFLLIYSLAY